MTIMANSTLPSNFLPKPGGKVILGMSGGVDSSVAALLLKQQGYAVEGLFMKNWEEDDQEEYCSAKADMFDALAVADALDIPLHHANFAADYWDRVFAQFLTEYQAGRTPNPDVLCNREIKFNLFRQQAEALGADLIATGHYARLQSVAGEVRLLKAADSGKDQTYFLQAVSQAQLQGVVFPLGDLNKTEVRRLARAAGFAIHDKKDSTGICFIGERRFKDFLASYLPAQPGDIVTIEGEVLGQHQGLMFHTLGQRQGLGIGGRRDAGEAPWYVVAKRLAENQLVVAQGNDHPALFAYGLKTDTLHWIGKPPVPVQQQRAGSLVGETAGEADRDSLTRAGKPLAPNHHEQESRLGLAHGEPDDGFSCTAKIRYRQPDQACVLHSTASGFEVRFREPQRAITPGQWVCLYDGEVCLGGGIIAGVQTKGLIRD